MINLNPAVCGWRDGWYVVPHEVTWRDLDGIGHVNNAVFFTYFEWARTKYWFDLHNKASQPDLGAADLNFIVAHAECDFLHQLGLSTIIEIRVRIAEMRRSSFDFAYEIRTRTEGELAATGKVVAVLYEWKSAKKVSIGDELRRAVRAFQHEVPGD